MSMACGCGKRRTEIRKGSLDSSDIRLSLTGGE